MGIRRAPRSDLIMKLEGEGCVFKNKQGVWVLLTAEMSANSKLKEKMAPLPQIFFTQWDKIFGSSDIKRCQEVSLKRVV